MADAREPPIKRGRKPVFSEEQKEWIAAQLDNEGTLPPRKGDEVARKLHKVGVEGGHLPSNCTWQQVREQLRNRTP